MQTLQGVHMGMKEELTSAEKDISKKNRSTTTHEMTDLKFVFDTELSHKLVKNNLSSMPGSLT